MIAQKPVDLLPRRVDLGADRFTLGLQTHRVSERVQKIARQMLGAEHGMRFLHIGVIDRAVHVCRHIQTVHAFHHRAAFAHGLIGTVECGYSHISASKASSGYESLYAFDQLKHKFTAAIGLQSIERLNVDIRLVYQERNGNYDAANADGTVETHPYNGFWTVDAGASYKWRWLSVFAEATNIGNSKYFDFSGLQLPGRWVKAGLKVELAKR